MQPDSTIPIGFCQCGCGLRTRISPVTDQSHGWTKGEPRRYLLGHATRRSKQKLPTDFWSLVLRGAAHECWPWQGTKNEEGYGSLRVSRRSCGAHRLAYELSVGPIPDGMFVLHHCDNPPCCNPAHLFLGTHQDNMTDMAAKGRGRSPKGSKKAEAKLTEDRVQEARHLFQKGHPEFGYTGLARRYGIGVVTMYKAITRQTWTHVS